MQNPFSISVIIPAYNAEQYLHRSIKSVLEQTFQPLEIIIVDDGSSDKTAEIAKSYKKNKVHFIHQKNSGAAAARNTGIRAANGEWIAFLDVDDEWRCHHLQNAVKILQNHPKIKWYGASVNQYIHESGKLIAKYREKKPGILINKAYFEDYMVAFPPYAHFSTPTMVIHQSVFKKVGMFTEDLRTGQDLDMWYRIGLQFPKVGYSHSVAANIYKRSTSLSYTKKQSFKKNLNLFKEREVLAASLGEEKRRRAEPRIMYWVTKLLKANLSQGEISAVREIFAEYHQRLAPRWFWLSRLYLAAPWVFRPVFNLRKSMHKHSKPIK